jgi:hypothetical protein
MSISEVGKRVCSQEDLPAASRPRMEPTPSPALPAELWAHVASYLDKTSLENFSQVNHFNQSIALRELNMRKKNKTIEDLKSLTDLINVNRQEKFEFKIDSYRNTFFKLRQEGILEISYKSEKALRRNLKLLAQNQVVKELSTLSYKCFGQINNNTTFMLDIERQYRSKKISMIGKALHQISLATTNPNAVRGFFLQKAAKSGHVEIARELFSGKDIPPHHRGWALQFAGEMGHLEIVKILYASGDISDNDLVLAFSGAASKGHIEIIKFLLQDKRIEESPQGECTILAAKNGHLPVIRALVSHGDIWEKDLNEALKAAAKKGHEDVVKFLLVHWDFEKKVRREVSDYEGNSRGCDIYKAFLNYKSVSHSALATAAQKGEMSVVKTYLAFKTFDEFEKGLAVACAAHEGHLEIVRILHAKGPINKDYKAKAVINACHKGHLKIVELLLADGPLDPEDKEWAIRLAEKHKHQDISAYIKRV